MELVIVLAIILLIFGPKRLPGLGKQLGTGMREFRDSIRGRGGDDDADDAPQPAALAKAEAVEAAEAGTVPEPQADRTAASS